jgi:hypothetical protein
MKILLSIMMTGLVAAAFAQEPEVDIDSTYFHPAASMYVQGNSAGSSNLVYTGLSKFPDNGKLLRLKELLDQQQEQEQNEDQNDDKNEDQQDQDPQDQEQNEDQQDQDQNQDEQDQDQNEQDQQDDQQNPEEEESQQQPPPSAEQMSEDEAQRLLDAMKQEEETKRLQLHPVMGAPVKVDKDW